MAGNSSGDQGDGPAEWGLVLKFDSDSVEFTRGFEAGIVWQATDGRRPWVGIVHARNAEMVMRIAESRGMRFSATDVGGDWLQVEIGDPE